MQIIGKYNVADVKLDMLDHTTTSQLYAMMNHEAFEGTKVAIMPDTHAGTGSVIGFTMTLSDKIVPNIVGVDISCGMMTLNLGKVEINEERMKAFHAHVQKTVPSGFHMRQSIHSKVGAFSDEVDTVLENTKGFGSTDSKRDRFLQSLGTLGGGNHFLEMNQSSNGDVYLVVHSGSRNFGLQIAKYHQDVAISKFDKKSQDFTRDMCYLTAGDGMEDYLRDMKVAQKYAELSRTIMLTELSEFFGVNVTKDNTFTTVHNYIDLDAGIIRKGAISAKAGEKVLIPLNMRDGSIIAIGKGNDDWNQSAPHGAGRLLSRSKAKERLSVEDMQNDMQGIYTWSVSKGTLDEAPRAYKDAQMIIDAVGETVDVVEVVKPVFNYKASE
jgi:RNA-splicing ligase RtcB